MNRIPSYRILHLTRKGIKKIGHTRSGVISKKTNLYYSDFQHLKLRYFFNPGSFLMVCIKIVTYQILIELTWHFEV